MVVRVDHSRHDEVTGAVDALRALWRVIDEAAVRNGDVRAAELTAADVDEPVLEDERCRHDGRA
jgi:hypothetical protein